MKQRTEKQEVKLIKILLSQKNKQKIDKLQTSQDKGDKSQTYKMRNHKLGIIMIQRKNSKKSLTSIFTYSYANKFENLEKIDNF